jgi:hypothetical protein
MATRHPVAWLREEPLLLELGQGPLDDCPGLLSAVRIANALRHQRVGDLLERSPAFASSPDAGCRLGQAVRDVPHAVIDQELVAKLLDH